MRIRELLLNTRIVLVAGVALGALVFGTAATHKEKVTKKREMVVIGGDRPAELRFPRGFQEGEQLPLVVVLHGFSLTGEITDILLGAGRLMDKEKFFLLLPQGEEVDGFSTWNSRPVPQDGPPPGWVDDSGYLSALADEAVGYGVDPSRIYFIGYSAGGFMVHRLACDHGSRFAGYASLAGGVGESPEWCPDPEPVSTVVIHGTDDQSVPYEGGRGRLGAEDTAAFWAQVADCRDSFTEIDKVNVTFFEWEIGFREGRIVFDGDWKDLFQFSTRAETDVITHRDCATPVVSQAWRVKGAGHSPIPRLRFFREVWNTLRDTD